MPHSLPAPALLLMEDANEDDECSEVNPDPGPHPKPSAKTVAVMKDVNTKLYIGTEVNIPTFTISEYDSNIILIRHPDLTDLILVMLIAGERH